MEVDSWDGDDVYLAMVLAGLGDHTDDGAEVGRLVLQLTIVVVAVVVVEPLNLGPLGLG